MTAFALADVFLTPSRRSLEDYVNHFAVRPGRACIIPNGVPAFPFDVAEVVKRRSLSWYQPRVVWVGRVSLEKRIDFILRSFQRFAVRRPDARLTMVGDGPFREEAVRYAETLGLGDRVEWVGYQPDPLPWLLPAHVFLHACLSEEFGYTLVEAMMAGLPVVAYDCPYGPGEILDGGRYGMLVRDEAEAAEALDELSRDFSLWRFFVERARRRAEVFELGRISEEYRRAFARLLEDRAR